MKRIFTVVIAVSCMQLAVVSCGGNGSGESMETTKAPDNESLLTDMLESDALRMISMADSMLEHGKVTETKANYFRAQAHYRLGQDLTAELCYKRALSTDELYQERPATYYFACDQLSTILTCKGDEQGSLSIATKGYAKARNDESAQGRRWAASLLHDIGYCQMRLGHIDEAEKNFRQAYTALKQLSEQDDCYDHLYSWARVSYNILDAYISTGHLDRATQWIDSVETAINRMVESPECSSQKAEEYIGSFYTHKASVLAMTGYKTEANKVYEKFLHLDYANTNIGIVDNAEYLEKAERWDDRANLASRIDSLLKAWNMPLSMYYLESYQIPNFNAYMKSGRRDEALRTAQMIADQMDSIVNYERKHNAAELSIMYETQEKELQIAEQQAQLRYQRMIAVAIASLLLIIFLAFFIYFRHKAAIKLEKKNCELEEKNRELTIANDRAEESSRMKTNFIQQISHEIRTPLNILSGFTQVLTTPDMMIDEDTRQEANREIMENTMRITGLVNKMLELSDVNSKTVIEMNDDVLPAEIAARAASNSGIENAAHIQFDLQIDKNVGEQLIHTNELQAVRALELLLDNAQKFTKQGRVLLSVGNADDGRIAFTVEDTGIGVPPCEAERIFNEFVQLDEYYSGTGIGLTVARSIARRLGGDIVLDTSYIHGARFVMTLNIKL